MAWHETITQMTTTTTTHADNFNAVHGELLENDKDLNSKITVLNAQFAKQSIKALLKNGWVASQFTEPTMVRTGDSITVSFSIEGGALGFYTNLFENLPVGFYSSTNITHIPCTIQNGSTFKSGKLRIVGAEKRMDTAETSLVTGDKIICSCSYSL